MLTFVYAVCFLVFGAVAGALLTPAALWIITAIAAGAIIWSRTSTYEDQRAMAGPITIVSAAWVLPMWAMFAYFASAGNIAHLFIR